MRTPEYRFIEIDVYGENTGERYFGQIEVKLYLTNTEKAEMARKTSKLISGIDLRHEMASTIQLIANLDAHIKTKPEWWGEDGMSMEDNEPIYAVSKKLREVQMMYAREKSGGVIGKEEEKAV